MNKPLLTKTTAVKQYSPSIINNTQGPLTEGLQEYNGIWDTQQIVHLLKRVLFGARPADIAYFKTKTMQQSVDELLQPTAAPATVPLNNYSVNGYVDVSAVALWQTWINSGITLTDKELNGKRSESFKTWWLGQALKPYRSIHEKMVVFWHNHFATNTTNSGTIIIYYYGNMRWVILKQWQKPSPLIRRCCIF
jgi:uncharacterized protein (DUF1800 family)